MTIKDVAKNIENIDLKGMLLSINPYFKRVNEDKLKSNVLSAFSGYVFDGCDNIIFEKEGFNKWDFTAKVARYNAPEIRIYLNKSENLVTEIHEVI